MFQCLPSRTNDGAAFQSLSLLIWMFTYCLYDHLLFQFVTADIDGHLLFQSVTADIDGHLLSQSLSPLILMVTCCFSLFYHYYER